LAGTTQLNDIRILFLSGINAARPGIDYKRQPLARRYPLGAFSVHAAAQNFHNDFKPSTF
jgi:hypothetical protein